MPKKTPEIPWISTDEYLPKEFDLCKLLSEKGKVHIGWLVRKEKQGPFWDGLNIPESDKIVRWKRHME